MAGSDGLDLALGADAAGFDFAVGVGSMYTWSSEGATGSGLFWDWSVNFLGSSPGSFPLFPHSTREGFLLLFSMAHILHSIVGHPVVPCSPAFHALFVFAKIFGFSPFYPCFIHLCLDWIAFHLVCKAT